MTKLFDDECRRYIGTNKNLLVPWWIMAAWAYEVDDEPIISDALFDEIAQQINTHWASITHRHKERLDRSALKSALAINGKWPPMAKGAVQHLRKAHDDRSRD